MSGAVGDERADLVPLVVERPVREHKVVGVRLAVRKGYADVAAEPDVDPVRQRYVLPLVEARAANGLGSPPSGVTWNFPDAVRLR